MRVLLDTHALIWALSQSSKLAPETQAIVKDPESEIYVSVVSLWEISIKQSLGKLRIPENLLEVMVANRFHTLPIHAKHAMEVRHLPLHHRDPFDRMLIAQARLEGMTIATRDRAFEGYGVPIMVA